MRAVKRTVQGLVASRSVPSCKPGSTVATAVSLMCEGHVSCVLVLDDAGLAGIFTERDYLNRVAAPGRDPDTTLISEVMTDSPETLHLTDCVTWAINKMAMGGFRNVPILDDADRPVAVLSVRDVVDHLVEVFQEVDVAPVDDSATNDWIDIGGG